MADSITEFGVLAHIFDLSCINYTGGYIEGFFIMINFWPLFVALILMGIVIEHTEIFYSAFAWAFWGQWLINWGIRIAINSPGPEAVCSPSVQLPTLSTDLMTFSTLFLMIMSGFAFDFPIRWYKLLMITILGPVVLYARVYLKLNTPQQMLWGVLSGFIGAMCWSALIYFVLRRYKTSILYKTFLGTDYIDTLMDHHRPILATNNYPLEIQMKIKDHEMLESMVEDYLLRKQIMRMMNQEDVERNEKLLSVEDVDYMRPTTSVYFINEFFTS